MRTADGGRRTADGGRRTADGGRRTADGGRQTADKINNKNQKTLKKKYINKYKNKNKNNQLIIRKRKNMSKHPRKLVVYIYKKKLPFSTSAFLKIGKPCKPIKCNTCYHFSLWHVLILNFTSSSRYQKICVIGVQIFFSLFVHYISSLQKLAYICYNIYYYIMAGDLSKLY